MELVKLILTFALKKEVGSYLDSLASDKF